MEFCSEWEKCDWRCWCLRFVYPFHFHIPMTRMEYDPKTVEHFHGIDGILRWVLYPFQWSSIAHAFQWALSHGADAIHWTEIHNNFPMTVDSLTVRIFICEYLCTHEHCKLAGFCNRVVPTLASLMFVWWLNRHYCFQQNTTYCTIRIIIHSGETQRALAHARNIFGAEHKHTFAHCLSKPWIIRCGCYFKLLNNHRAQEKNQYSNSRWMSGIGACSFWIYV